ncbi:hypothetical protein LXL04_012109 [Taraxacum kok-saghyz]
MDGRRITANPRPSTCRRVVAKKRQRGGVDGFVNSVKKLQRREICSKRGRAFSMCDAQERFRNIRLQEEYDTHDPKGHCPTVLPFLKNRSKILEIVAAHDVVFALAQSGVCAAFNRETNKRICFLNVTPDEVIRSLFYNKNNDSLITVSMYASDSFSSLKCRTTRIEYIRRGQPDAGFALFESESLKWPGFVEFDDVNGKVLTFSAQDSIYKVFDLKNYMMLYSISDKNVQEIKISPGIMLLIYNQSSGHVPLKILSIEDGIVLKSFNHLLHRNKKVDFIEQFNEKLLVKQENENLQILDVRTSEVIEVSRTEFMTPSAFIFLYENQLFLTFRNRTVAVWNFRGELVTSFEDHLLWHPDCNTNNIYITSDQDLIISYCKAGSDNDPLPQGSINVSNILTGKCLAKVKASNSDMMRGIEASVTEALEDITALFYDEDRSEIYTGNRLGLIHSYSEAPTWGVIEKMLVEMEGGQSLAETLDYIEFHIFPSRNRYEASVWSSNREENLASGTLEHLSFHSPEIKNLSSKNSDTNFKVLPPDSINDACWFTTATLKRFLHVIGLPDIVSIGKEISQLDDTRGFLISSSEKSDILVAVDLRLTALKEELSAALNQTIVSKYSLNDISDLENFALHFGAKDLRDSLQKCVELSSQEDEDSNEEQDTERGRAVTRSSIAPKRSASPMKRIQIGRSGSRRTASLSIKSLNYFPAGREKEKSTPLRGECSEEQEDSHTPVKNNVLRMSVQDKISLFESKQRDQGVQKTNVSVGGNKAVLRRWSSEMVERPTHNLPDETLNSPENVGPDGKTEMDNNNNFITDTCPEKGTSEELGLEVEKHPASIECSQEKGVELNVTSDDRKSKIQKEQRGGIFDKNNKRKEEKLQKQTAGKSKIISSNVSGANRKHQNEPHKNSTLMMNSRTPMKKPTRKSSSPQPATATCANSTPTNRKPQSPASKVENLQPRLKKTLKSTKPDGDKNNITKATNEKKHPTSTVNRKTTRRKIQTPKEDTKPSFYNKVTKKNSVVPLETKPFLRKGSGIGPGVGPVVIKTRQPDETSRTSDNLIQREEKKVDIMIINHEMESESETWKNLEPEVVNSEQSERCGDLGLELPEISIVAEEKVEISPNAWVMEEEEEEKHEDEIIPFKESPTKIGITLPRVRHSLSQMLLEETNESEIGEWGNDSHPPTLIYQKDAPRGLKRLLKFARKAKADSHLTDWSSPEGDDDIPEESKATRSFFSLSAFRGNKTNDTKLLHR